jgi:RNA polymerase sigma-70 factor (ECF subfamily)
MVAFALVMSQLSRDNPESPADLKFTTILSSARDYLLAQAASRLPPTLRAKGGASDLVQETYATAHRCRHQFRGRTAAELRAWLRSILVSELRAFRRAYLNTAARDIRRELTLADGLTASADSTVVSELVRFEELAGLESAVARLGPLPREAVILRCEHGLSFAQIGDRLGCTEEAARKTFTRALTQLRGRAPADSD